MIFDIFLYNGEEACLKIRMEELKGLEVTHILVESPFTFTGNIKHTSYRLKHGKTINPCNFGFINMPNNGNPWDNETAQRNYMLDCLKEFNPTDDDIVIISDVDEIPARHAVESYKPEMGLTALVMDNFWYKLNCLTERQTWKLARIMPYSYLKETTPDEVRRSGYPSEISNAGHHFSYLGNADFICNKLESFSHQEFNTAKFKDKAEINRKIEEGISLNLH